MGDEGPKLYANKPKKAQLKQSAKEFAPPPPSSSAAASYTMGSQPPPPPPPPKESFARRYKFLWPLLLTVNLAVGAYLFMRTSKKDQTITEEEDSKAVSSTPVPTTVTTTIAATEKPVPIIAEPVKPREPIPEDRQRELFKWILEEKRKLKPRDREERKRLDEEKAILKQFIRAKSLPPV
ncbi:uncharacterized protein LOC104449964 isoform X1 [Eucalyptus grandis]|uniref:Uncharacterized protein n=4 Tax=Eucalyptus grandis TaxID=71139 RepID=A0A059BUF3_EUCGR|nr:uncharacterized protein LOC104449964 isoform X1 [Eucalyptus grandis]KAK3426753.1 hypothetical protein EUGRSUZ_F03128 [Eucalyptus grandis]